MVLYLLCTLGQSGNVPHQILAVDMIEMVVCRPQPANRLAEACCYFNSHADIRHASGWRAPTAP